MRQDLRPAVRKYQRQFMGELFPVMDYSSAVVFIFCPVVHELYRLPVRDMAKFAFAKHAVQHSRRTEQPDMTPCRGVNGRPRTSFRSRINTRAAWR